MTPADPLTVQKIKQRLVHAVDQRAALDLAMSQFGDDFDFGTFTKAWQSSDPAELLKANALQGAFENVVNQLLGAAGEVCHLEEWWGNREPNMNLALRLLKQNSVIAERVRSGISDVKDLRDQAQHDYANTRARSIHDAVLVLGTVDAAFIASVRRWLQVNHPYF